MIDVDAVPLEPGGHALKFSVADGRCAGVLGAQEHLLARFAETLAGARAPIAGRILIDDVDVRRSDGGGARISAYIPRAAHRLVTLGEHLSAVAAARGTMRFTPAQAIDRLGLNARTRLNTAAAQSSAALAAALMPESRLIVLHQPFAALDPAARHRAIDWIRAMAETPASIIVTGTAEGDVRAVSHQVIDAGAGR